MSNMTKTEDIMNGILIKEDFCTYYDNSIIEYYMYKEKKDDHDVYSIRAIQKNNGLEICRAFAYDISHEQDMADFIFHCMVKGAVPPYCLKEILYDFMP